MENYHLKHETVTVNNIDYQIRSLKDRQQFYDYEQRAEALGISSASWPLFGVVWVPETMRYCRALVTAT